MDPRALGHLHRLVPLSRLGRRARDGDAHATRRLGWPRGARAAGSAALSLALWFVVSVSATPARALPVELLSLQRSAEPHAGIAIDYALKLEPPRAVVEALRRGVPLHFVAQATLLRPRWWWRDERVARASRSWRLTWQPLASNWRVSQGSLAQHHATLDEAMASMTRTSNWLIAEPHRLSTDERYIVVFTWRLDTSQLPAPMQLEVGGASDWNLRVDAEFGVSP